MPEQSGTTCPTPVFRKARRQADVRQQRFYGAMGHYEQFYMEGKYCALLNEDPTMHPTTWLEAQALKNGMQDWHDFRRAWPVPKDSL